MNAAAVTTERIRSDFFAKTSPFPHGIDLSTASFAIDSPPASNARGRRGEEEEEGGRVEEG